MGEKQVTQQSESPNDESFSVHCENVEQASAGVSAIQGGEPIHR